MSDQTKTKRDPAQAGWSYGAVGACESQINRGVWFPWPVLLFVTLLVASRFVRGWRNDLTQLALAGALLFGTTQLMRTDQRLFVVSDWIANGPLFWFAVMLSPSINTALRNPMAALVSCASIFASIRRTSCDRAASEK